MRISAAFLWTPVLAALALVSCADQEIFEGDPCTLHTGSAGVCLRASKCSWLERAVRTGEITLPQLVRCGFIREEPIVCCRTLTSTKANRVGVRPSAQVCATYDGKRSQLSFHIIGGGEVDGEEVPFIAALGYQLEAGEESEQLNRSGYKWACGSSLITPRFLVTAAHCIDTTRGRPLVARMGTINLVNPPTPMDVQDSKIKNIIIHPSYKKSQKYDDIALIEVTDPFKFDSGVQPICLNADETDLDRSTVLYAAGWGSTGQGDSPNALLRVNLTTVEGGDCAKVYKDFKKRVREGIRPASQYCAVGFERSDLEENLHGDTCDGDSGGPLYYVAGSDDAPKYYLLGVTSFGAGCGSANPSVYTRVSYYLDWIESHVWPESV